jgi:Na+/proline symporter
MGVLATFYTMLGGLTAVLWTDVLQFVILVGGAIWVAVSLITGVSGGLPEIWRIAAATNHLNVIDMRFSLIEMTGLFVLFSYIFQLMQDYGTDQVSVQRLLAIPNLKGMARAVITNSFFDLSIISLLLFCGIGMFAYYQQHPGVLPTLLATENQDRILPFYIITQLPNGVSGLVITGIFAAAMSSMDSGINSLTTVVVNDFIRPLRRIARSEAHDVKLARMLTFGLGAFAVGVAFYVSTIKQILAASSQFLGLFAGPILALFLMGILTRRGKFSGWVAGVIPAIIFTWFGVIKHTWMQNGIEVKVHWIYYFPICFGITIIIGYLVSLVLPGPLADKQYTILGGNSAAETADDGKVLDGAE